MVDQRKKDFGGEISKIMARMIRAMTSRKDMVMSRGDITVANIAIIEYLSEKGVSSMGNIAHILNLSMSAATSIIDKMIDSGYVKRERSKEDRRVVLVELDKKGEETAEKIMVERKNALNDFLSPLEDKEKEEYLRLITKIHDNIRAKDDK